MSKLNVNVATPEELIEVAGLRPEMAEAIAKLRDERGKLGNIEELNEVQGVGPATLEQLRQAFTFGPTAEEKAERQQVKADEKVERERVEAEDKAKRERMKAERERVKAERERIEAAKEAEQLTKETAETLTKAGRDTATAGVHAASRAARNGLQLVQQTAGSTAQVHQETMRQSAEGTAELGKLYADLLKEQTQHGVQVAQAFGKAFNWHEAVQVQSDFMRASFERMVQLNSRYIEIVQSVMPQRYLASRAQPKRLPETAGS